MTSLIVISYQTLLNIFFIDIYDFQIISFVICDHNPPPPLSFYSKTGSCLGLFLLV